MMHKQYVKKTSTSREFKPVKATAEDRFITLQKYFLSLLLQSETKPAIIEKVKHLLQPEVFSFPAYGQIYSLVLAHPVAMELLVTMADAGIKSLLDELYLFASTESELASTGIEKIAVDIKRLYLKQQMKDLLSAPNEAQNEARLTQINAELKELEKMAVKIYNT